LLDQILLNLFPTNKNNRPDKNSD